MNKQTITTIVVAIVFAAGGFFGGIKYQQSKAQALVAGRQGGQFFAQGGGGGQRRLGGQNGADFVTGKVLSKDSGSITVQSQTGGSKIVIFGPSAQFGKMVAGTADDVTIGTNIIVIGSANPDGSITAQNVQIRSASSTPLG